MKETEKQVIWNENVVIADADYVVRIPMHYGIDSLNVAATAAIACWQLRPTPHHK